MPNVGPMELIIILIIALVVFGPKRLPELGRSLGSGMREFKDSVSGKSRGEDGGREEGERRSRRVAPAELPNPTSVDPAETPVEAVPEAQGQAGAPDAQVEAVPEDEPIAGREH